MQINLTINIDDRILNFLKRKESKITLLASGFFLLSIALYSATIDKPWTFNSGDLIVADQINENFDILYDKVNELSAVSTSSGLGTPQEIISETLYHAETDGFVYGTSNYYNYSIASRQGYIFRFCLNNEEFNPYNYTSLEQIFGEMTITPSKGTAEESFCFPVKKGKYWSLMYYGQQKAYWMPIVN
jgi:hypothetical protein